MIRWIGAIGLTVAYGLFMTGIALHVNGGDLWGAAGLLTLIYTALLVGTFGGTEP